MSYGMDLEYMDKMVSSVVRSVQPIRTETLPAPIDY
jgi:hypothetical protein